VQQPHVRQGLGDHRDGRHAHGDAHEAGEDQAVVGGGPGERDRHQIADDEAEGQRQQQTAEADPGGGRLAPPHHGDIEVRSGQPDQQQDADLADRVEQVHLLDGAGQEDGGHGGGEMVDQRRAQQHPRGEFTHDRGQAEPHGQPAQQRGDQQQRRHGQEQDEQGLAAQRGQGPIHRHPVSLQPAW
jgi:hypothetical protein